MSSSSSNTTEISKPLLGGLVAAVVVLLMLVSFLLGRQTSPSPTAVAVAPNSGATPGTVERPVNPSRTLVTEQVPTLPPPSHPQPQPAQLPPAQDPVPPAPAPIAPATPAPVAPPPQPSVPQARPSQPHPANNNPAPVKHSDENAAVATYLREVDMATAGSPEAKDGNSMANEILQKAMQGDSSGFDALLASSRQTEQTLKGIHPPANCKAHHDALLRQVSRSITLLSKVKGAVASNDLSSLSALSSQGQAMQKEAEEFRKADEKLRSLTR